MSQLRTFCFLFLSVLFFVLGQPNAIFEDGFWFFSFIALAPAFYAVGLSSLKRSFVLGAVFGLVSYALMYFWLAGYAGGLFVLAILGYAVLYGLCFMAMKRLSLCHPDLSFHLMALVFCAFEYVKSLGPLGFSYGTIGYSLWKFRPLLMAASVGGVWAVSGVCVFFSASLAQALRLYGEGRLVKAAVPALVLFLAALSLSFFGWRCSRRKAVYRDVTVILVQNNADSTKYDGNSYRNDIASLVSLSKEALAVYPDADFVVWPETAVVPPILHYYTSRTDPSRFNAISSVLGLMLRSPSCFIVGNHHIDESGEDCNAALVFDSGKGNVLPPEPELYIKQHLVPFTECLPFYDGFKWLYDRIVPDKGFLWRPGDAAKVFTDRGISYSVPICFEDCFGSLCSRFVREGAGCLINLCNDSWAMSAVCQRQHLAMSVFRAVENGVPVLRSTASGVTCVIDRDGRVLEELAGFCEDFLGRKVSVPTSRSFYPYTLWGDWVAWCELLLACGLFVRSMLVRTSRPT